MLQIQVFFSFIFKCFFISFKSCFLSFASCFVSFSVQTSRAGKTSGIKVRADTAVPVNADISQENSLQNFLQYSSSRVLKPTIRSFTSTSVSSSSSACEIPILSAVSFASSRMGSSTSLFVSFSCPTPAFPLFLDCWLSLFLCQFPLPSERRVLEAPMS